MAVHGGACAACCPGTFILNSVPSFSKTKRFAFVFTTASGHTNPSLPIARLLVGRGHEVIYLSSAVFQTAIEGTGAAFVGETAVLTDLYHSGMDNFMLMFKGLVTEFGCETAPFVKQQLKVKNVIVERQLPGLIQFLKEASPPFDAVVYDPIMMNAAIEQAGLHSD